ncbi:MAG TPA: 50S ribosomal protein L10 [Candidatus Saccharimonadales bacterium]|nr:50S ribosomal protein L10 [Candidatus Saccharimonadales bacterium]
MNRHQKENTVQGLQTKFTANEAAFLVKFQGLTVSDLQELRFKLEEKDGEFKVAKNRLMKLAMTKEADSLGLGSLMKGQTALIFVKSDFTGVAKVLNDFAKKNTSLEIVAGCCESQLFDTAGVKQLATIPSREVLLARLCGTLNAVTAKFVYVLAQILEQKSAPVAKAQTEPAAESAAESVAESVAESKTEQTEEQ